MPSLMVMFAGCLRLLSRSIVLFPFLYLHAKLLRRSNTAVNFNSLPRHVFLAHGG